jgi:hypothetical protein
MNFDYAIKAARFRYLAAFLLIVSFFDIRVASKTIHIFRVFSRLYLRNFECCKEGQGNRVVYGMNETVPEG